MKQLITLLALIPTLCFGQWTQLGNHIEGTQQNGYLGQSVSINDSGQVMSIGSHQNNNANGTNSGQVQIYELTGNTWTPKGNFIDGNGTGNVFGYDHEISDNGNVIAIGAPAFLANPDISGYASVYAFNGTNWVLRGSEFLGDAIDDNFGNAVSLSSDGSIVAIAAVPNNSISYIRVYQWDGTVWNQMGSDINDATVLDGFGRSIRLSSNGTTLVVGAEAHDTPSTDIGRLSVYEWNGTNWIQKGTDIFGEAENDFFGKGVAINNNGTIIIAGAADGLNQTRGYVKVFEWNGTNWAQKGSKLLGEEGSAFFGISNDINSAGDIIISGTLGGSFAKVHNFQGTDWVLLESISVAGGFQFGSSVSMNATGSRVIVGDNTNPVGGNTLAGRATVFENNIILSTDDFDEEIMLTTYPNPSSNYIQVESEQNIQSYKIVSIEGKLVQNQTIINKSNFTIDISNISNGIYVLQLVSDSGSKSVKLIKE